jgi:hypothetical protein
MAADPTGSPRPAWGIWGFLSLLAIAAACYLARQITWHSDRVIPVGFSVGFDNGGARGTGELTDFRVGYDELDPDIMQGPFLHLQFPGSTKAVYLSGVTKLPSSTAMIECKEWSSVTDTLRAERPIPASAISMTDFPTTQTYGDPIYKVDLTVDRDVGLVPPPPYELACAANYVPEVDSLVDRSLRFTNMWLQGVKPIPFVVSTVGIAAAENVTFVENGANRISDSKERVAAGGIVGARWVDRNGTTRRDIYLALIAVVAGFATACLIEALRRTVGRAEVSLGRFSDADLFGYETDEG